MSKFTCNKDSRYGIYNPDARITRDKLLTLRAVTLETKKQKTDLPQVIKAIKEFFVSLIIAPADMKAHTMCKYYGHVIRGAARSYPPCCDDCGASIKSPKDMRRAVPIQ